jgi:hypothetical protein
MDVNKKITIPVHPACDTIRMMNEGEYRSLVENIRKNGQRDPVVFLGDELLDGRNRWLACQELDIPCEFVTVTLKDIGNPIDWVIDRNLERRHMAQAEKALAGVDLKKLYAEDGKERMIEGAAKGGRNSKGVPKSKGPKNTGSDSSHCTVPEEEGKPSVLKPPTKRDMSKYAANKSSERAAKRLGVSARSIERAEVVIEGGSKDLIEAVREGKVSIADGQKLVKLGISKVSQNKILKRGRDGVKDHLAECDKVRRDDPLYEAKIARNKVCSHVGATLRALSDYHALLPRSSKFQELRTCLARVHDELWEAK